MPFEYIQNGQVSGERPVAELPPLADVRTGEVVGATLEREGIVENAASALAGMAMNDFTDDPLYDPFEDMGGYEGYASHLSNARSKREMAHFKNKIDKEDELARTIASGNGWQQLLGVGNLIAHDPTMLIPVGGALWKTYRTGGKILEGAARTGATAAAISTGQEAFLQQTQITRTGEESAANIAAATLLSGFLGGAAGGLSKAQFDELATRLDTEMVTPKDVLSSESTVGAAARPSLSLEDETLKDLKRTVETYKKLPGFLQNPAMDMAVSASKVTRQIGQLLSDHSLALNKNTKFIPTPHSVELKVKAYNDTLKQNYLRASQEQWKKYRARVSEQKKAGGIPDAERLGTKPDGSMSFNEFFEQAGKAGARNDAHIIPEVEATAKAAREHVFDPILKRSEEVGIFENINEMDVKTADSWIKRMYNIPKILEERPKFKEVVMADLEHQRSRLEGQVRDMKLKKLDEEQTASLEGMKLHLTRLEEEMDDIAEQIIDRVTNQTGGRLPYDNILKEREKGQRKVGLRGSAKQRVWNIADEKIEPWLVRDLNAIVDSHIRTMAPDNELMGTFGTLDFDVVKKQIQEDYNALRFKKEAGDKSLAKVDLDASMKKDMANLQATWEKLRGVYAQPDDYAAPAHVLERTAMAWNFTRLLGDMVTSSIPDLGRHVMVHGMNRAFRQSFVSMIKDWKGFKMAASEAKEMGTAADMVLSSTALRRGHMDDYTPVTGRIDAFSQKASIMASTATGMNIWNSAQKTFAGIMSQNRMLEAIVKFSKGGEIPENEIVNLASHGIGKDMAKRIAKQFEKFGETRDVVRVANARAWDDIEARNVFRLAGRKQVDEVIVTPGMDRPLWMSKPGWKMIGQFKSFSFSSMQRVTMVGIQQADAHTLQGLALMTFLGSQVYFAKSWLAGKKISDDPRVWITEGIDRSGITGWFFDVNNIAEKLTSGRVGVNALVGGPPMSRYASRNAVGALLGPSFGLGQDLFGISAAAFSGNWTASDTHAARKVFPLQNIPYLRGLFDQIEHGANSLFGIPDAGKVKSYGTE